jgi:FMN phosphatase YigB (HAD superfamily)
MAVKTVFFDKTNCIIETKGVSLVSTPRALQVILRYFNTPANMAEITKAGEEAIKEISKFYGRDAVELNDYRIFLKHFLDRFFIKPTETQLTEAYNMFLEARASQMVAANGAVKTLSELRKMKIQTAVLTNSFYERAVYQLDKVGLLKHLNFIITSDLVNKTKVQVEMFGDALAITKTKPSEAVMVSHDDGEMVVAKEAGMATVKLVKVRDRGASKPDYHIRELSELLRLPLFK